MTDAVRVDGEWDVTAKGMGFEQTARVTLRTRGDAVEGEVVDGAQRYPLTGGSLDGDELRFTMSITEPIRANLSATVTVKGDRMTGSARANALMKVKLAAVRVG